MEQKKFKCTWTFEKTYTENAFYNLCQERNDAVVQGYSVIQRDFDLADSSDDFHLTCKVEEI